MLRASISSTAAARPRPGDAVTGAGFMMSATTPSRETPRRIARRTSPSVTRPASRPSASATRTACLRFLVMASRASRRVAPARITRLGFIPGDPSRREAQGRPFVEALLDQPSVEGHRSQDLDDARGGAPVAIRVGRGAGARAEGRRLRSLDAAEDVLPRGLDVDNIRAAQAASLSRADIDHRQPDGRRLDEPARGVADHEIGVSEEREVEAIPEIAREPAASRVPGRELLEPVDDEAP